VNTVLLTDGELAVVRNAMQMYLRSFGHNEAEVLVHAKEALAKLAAATRDSDETAADGDPAVDGPDAPAAARDESGTGKRQGTSVGR
jgi:hypothetical protein